MIQPNSRAWGLGIIGILVVVGIASPAIAQLVPDRSLGAEPSVVTPGTVNGQPADLIGGGAQRGALLFHSFRDFNVQDGGRVYFGNPSGVANILTRVTGTTPSNILGTLGVNGSANLFLLNPNGILFGPNARLDMRGSFVASSADRLLFNDGVAFSASDPQAPPLLAISAPIGLQYGSRSGEVRSQGAVLQVPNGQTLTFAGGNVSVDGGQLLAPGGRVELASVAAPGEVKLTQQGQEWRLSVPDGLARADVAIGNDAIVNVRSGGGGSIAITARNLTGTGLGTRIRAGIAAGLGTVDAQAGDIDINATAAINLDEMLISNAVLEGGTGNAGNINITTGTLFFTNGGRVSADTFGQGNAGNVTITAREAVSFDGATSDGSTSGAFSTVEFGGIGQGGNISITTGTLSLTRGGVVFAATFGQGNAGNVAITARDTVFLDGLDSIQFLSGAYNVVGSDGIGNGGNISITTGTLSITNGGGVNAGTFGQGNAGNITITAREAVSLDGSNDVAVSGVASQVLSEAIGQGGNVSITTGTLSLTNGGQLSVVTFGQGNAGSIRITADSIQISGTTADGEFGSGLFSSTQSRGNAGNLSIDTGNLVIRDGAQVSSGAFSEGAGGNLTVKATDSVQVIGESADGRASSGLFTQTENSGNAGNLRIETGNLIVRDGAQVSSGTRGSGAGGSLTVNAVDSIQVIGASRSDQSPSLLTARARASGNAGDITLKTRQLMIEDGGQVSSQQSIATATGSVGNIRIEAESLSVGNNASITVEDRRTIVDRQSTEPVGNINIQSNFLRVDRGLISAETASTDGGNIGLDVQDVLLLRNGGLISTNAGTAQAGGNGGNITFNGNFIVAVPGENSDITANAFLGRGGNIRITTQGIFGIEPRLRETPFSDITASSQFGISGTIALNTPDVDPSRGLVQLPTELQDVSGLIAATCPADEGSSFTITGRGGIPEDPRQPLMGEVVWLDDRGQNQSPDRSTQNLELKPQTSPTITEAQGWMREQDGTIVLVAAHSGAITPHSLPSFCSTPK